MSNVERMRPDTTFHRLRALVDGGHLAELTGSEAKIYLAYLSHADYETGEAFPSLARIASLAGIANVHRAREAVDRLVQRGIFQMKSEGRGKRPRVILILRPDHKPIALDRSGGADPQAVKRLQNLVEKLKRDSTCTGTGDVPISTQNRVDSGACTGTAYVLPTGTPPVPQTNKNRSEEQKERARAHLALVELGLNDEEARDELRCSATSSILIACANVHRLATAGYKFKNQIGYALKEIRDQSAFAQAELSEDMIQRRVKAQRSGQQNPNVPPSSEDAKRRQERLQFDREKAALIEQWPEIRDEVAEEYQRQLGKPLPEGPPVGRALAIALDHLRKVTR